MSGHMGNRFHVVSEFDDSKRSCRRRLAGHNERRRKSSHHDSASRNSAQGTWKFLFLFLIEIPCCMIYMCHYFNTS